jgi:anaerobic selenocysteine-containing dehydrogenase
MNRRDFIKISSSLGALAVMAGSFFGLTRSVFASHLKKQGITNNKTEFVKAGFDLKTEDWKKLIAIPSTCQICPSYCAIIGYVDASGRLVKIEGNPLSPNNKGLLCAKGQAGKEIAYNPDRILNPLKRIGKRGEGKWQNISWDEALDMIVNGYQRDNKKIDGLKSIYESDNRDSFIFHYGKGSDPFLMWNFIGAFFAKSMTKTIIGTTSGLGIGKPLTIGNNIINDVKNSKYILIFGCNVLDAHPSHLALSHRLIEAITNGVKVVTFDVRLSNTAARSTQWIPIRPGTDSAVMLAMAHVIMESVLYDEEFINNWTTTNVTELKAHLKQYTPQWAEKISGVPFNTIWNTAIEFASNKPCTVISYRGVSAHYNGTMAERCACLLEAITGSIGQRGGSYMGVKGRWGVALNERPIRQHELSYSSNSLRQLMRINSLLDIKKDSAKVYLSYGANPAYGNGDCREIIKILKDVEKIPFSISVDTSMSESAQLSDLILPDATYLERYSLITPVSFDMTPFIQICQPVIKPMGQSMAFCDIMIALAEKIGGDLSRAFPFKVSRQYIEESARLTEGLKDDPDVKQHDGAYEFMRQFGVFTQGVPQTYQKHLIKLQVDELKGTTIDSKTGVIWKDSNGKTYGSDNNDYKNYVGQMVKGTAYIGFPPDGLSKSGKIEIYSNILKSLGHPPLPEYLPIPEHAAKKTDELILISYKINVHSNSLTSNSKSLTEIYHENPAWINTLSAKAMGIKTGDRIKIKSSIFEIETLAWVTNQVHPEAIAISHHCGHWAGGRYAFKTKQTTKQDKEIWWRLKGKDNNGVHPNWIIANIDDPIGGQWCGNDMLVTVTKI